MLMMMDTTNLSHHSKPDMTPAPNTGALRSNSDNDPESMNTETVNESQEHDMIQNLRNNMSDDILKAQQIESDLSQNQLGQSIVGGGGVGGGGNPSQLLTAALAAATLAASGNMTPLSAQDQWFAGLGPTLIQMFANQQNTTETSSPMIDSLCDNSRLSSASSVCSDDNSQSSKSSLKRRKQSSPSKHHEKDLQAFLKDMLQNSPLQSALQQQQQQTQLQQEEIQREHAKEEHHIVAKEQEEKEHCRAAVATTTATSVETPSEALLRADCRTDTARPVSVSLTGSEFTSSARESQLENLTTSAQPTSKCSLNESSSNPPVSTLSSILHPPPSSVVSSSFPSTLGLDMKETNDPQQQQQQLFLNMFANLQHKFIQQQQQQSAVLFCPHCQCPCSSDDQLQQHIDMEHGSLKFFQDAVAAAAATSDGMNGTADFQKLCEQFALQQKLLQDQQQSKSQPSSINTGKKRKRHSTSPSARSAASDISTASGADSDHSSAKEEEIERKLSPKDVNHNLLQSSSNSTSQNQITNAFNPMISHTPTSTPPSPPLSSSQQHNSTLTHPMNESSMMIDHCSTPPHSSVSPFGHNSNPAAAAIASMFPPNSLPPFIIQQMLNNAANNGVPLPPGSTPPSGPGGLTLNGMPLPPSMGMRIFNPEAYCELCNKEFCNKYFLKTHKANKHGIYTDSPMPNGSGPDVPPIPMSRSSMGGVSPGLITSQSPIGTPKQAQSLIEAGQIPSSLSQFFNQNPSPSSNSMSTSMLNRLGSIPLNLINLDSYCEICQKEFCNKYFLKKHKQKIHGYIYQGDTAIPPPNLAQQIAQSGPNGAQHYQQIQQLHALQAQMSQQGRGGQGSPGQVSLTDSIQEQLAKVASPFPPFDRQSCMNMEAFARLTSSSPPLLPPLLINPEAFCEICCKEFHNKSFLETHKATRHDEKSDNSSVSEHGFDSTQNVVEPGQRDPTSYGNAGIDLLAIFIQQIPVQHNHSVMCEMCSQTLPNVYLVAMHKLYHHNVPFDNTKKDAEEGEVCRQTIPPMSPKPTDAIDSDNEIINEIKMQTNDAHSDRSNDTTSTLPANNSLNGTPGQDLQKLHSMIKDLGTKNEQIDDGSLKYMCHICQAEFDIRLILKAHLVSEHNFPPNDEAAFFQMLTTTGDNDKGHLTQFLTPPSQESTCEICFKEFRSKLYLKTHKQKFHGFSELESEKSPNPSLTPAMLSSIYQMQKTIPPLPPPSTQSPTARASSPVQAFSNFPSIPLPKPTAPRSIITGRNYCNICNKELCNKYFMKTHMLKMHNINIDEHPISDTSTIGGVTCDICQKELCSKYFLKVHKQNTHGIYEDPAGQMMLGTSYKTKQASKVAAVAAAAAAAVQVQHAQQQSQLMPPPSNGIGPGLPPLPGSPDMGAFNPMLIMSMMQQAAVAAASASSGNDGKEDSNDEFNESCQLCDRKFKNSKYLKSHLFNDHIELISMMRSTGEIGQAISNTTGANLEHLSKLCMVCGQNCSDRLSMNIHIVKEHKVTPEELALGLAGNIKMAAFLAAAATASAAQEQQQQQQELNPELNGQGPISPRQTLTPISRISTPNSVSSPRPTHLNFEESYDPKRQSNNNSNALQNIILKNPSILQNPMALMAAAAQSHPEIMAQFLANLQTEQAPAAPAKIEKEEKPPGRFACNLCEKVYRHSHSLHRHQLSHKKEELAAKTAAVANPNEPAKMSSPPMKEPTKVSTKPKNKRYRCSKCNKKFRTRELCLVHIRSQHSSNNPSDSKAHNLPPSPSASSEDLNQIEAQSSQTTDKITSSNSFNLSSIPSPSVDDEEMDDIEESIDDVKVNDSNTSAKDSTVGVAFESHRTAISQVMN